MSILMIAVIMKNENIIGYRMLDTKEKKYVDASVKNVENVIRNKVATIDNLDIVDGNIVGSNGILDRYPKITASGELIGRSNPLIVVDQITNNGETVGYTVTNYQGMVRKARNSDVIAHAKQYGIANGKVVMKDNIEFISSIVGSYQEQKVSPSKYASNVDEGLGLRIAVHAKETKDNTRVGKNTDIEIGIELDESDVFEAMTEAQRMTLQIYYSWYTIDKYKELAKNVRLKLAVGKAEKLAELRGITKWKFGGVWDTGYTGASYCELGHPLRYEYYAIPDDDLSTDDDRIVFGETCAADFFHISPEDMRNLVKTRTIMSDEIQLMADIVANGLESKYYKKLSLLYKILHKLGTRQNIEDAFGVKVGGTLVNFIYSSLPIPMSLAIECTRYIRKDAKKFWLCVFPEYADVIEEIYGGYRREQLFMGAKLYLNFIAENKLEGEYAYNPLDKNSVRRRDVGAYNKQSRAIMSNKLREISRYALCREFDYKEITDLLASIKELMEFASKLKEELKIYNIEMASKSELDELARHAESFLRKEKDKEIEYAKSIVWNSLVNSGEMSYYRKCVRSFSRYEEHRRIEQLKKDIDSSKDYGLSKIIIMFIEHLIDAKIIRRMQENIQSISNNGIEEVSEVQNENTENNSEHTNEASKQEEEVVVDKQEKVVEAKENKEEDTEEKTEVLKKLMNDKPNIPETREIRIAKAILDTGKLYKDLSPRQKYRIDQTIAVYENRNYNQTYRLDEREDIKSLVKSLIEKADSVEMSEVLVKYPNTLKIAYTVEKYNKASDKQLKYLNSALEMLNNA